MAKRVLGLLIAATLTFAACDFTGSVRAGGEDSAPSQAVDQVDLPEIDLDQDQTDAPGTAVTEVVEETLPSVVNVRVQSVRQNRITGAIEEGRGAGSGVVIDPEGVIVTNNHVIAGAVDVTVAFNDGRDPLEGIVVGAVPENDLAVIKVEADDLDAIEIGASDNLDLGESVVAIGFPLDLGGPTVTQGIISGLERTIRFEEGGEVKSLEGLLQTDAAINPGNSGGALVDMEGRLVGINTAAAQASSAENIGFAISIDEAVPVVQEIIEDPPEKQAYIGAFLDSVASSTDAARYDHLDPDARGAMIVGVLPGGPVEDAGIEEGSLIVRLDDEEIASRDDLTNILRERDPGETVELEYVTLDGDNETVELELGTRPLPLEE